MPDKNITSTRYAPQFFWKGIVAFLASVSAAAFTVELALSIRAVMRGFESATGKSWETKIDHLLTLAKFGYAIAWIWAFVFSLIPFLIGLRIAQQKNSFTRSFFIKGAIITGALLSPAAAIMPNLGINVQEDIGDYVIHQFVFFLPCFIVAGAVAGLTCWIVLKPKTIAASGSIKD